MPSYVTIISNRTTSVLSVLMEIGFDVSMTWQDFDGADPQYALDLSEVWEQLVFQLVST